MRPPSPRGLEANSPRGKRDGFGWIVGTLVLALCTLFSIILLVAVIRLDLSNGSGMGTMLIDNVARPLIIAFLGLLSLASAGALATWMWTQRSS